jgi:hypothetical protein
MPPYATKFDVDSESIAYNLSKVQPEEAPAFLETLSGAYALVWYDERDSTWNIARNEDRPLHVMPLSNGSTMYLSSEVGILLAGVSKDILVEPDKHILSVTVGELWKIKSSEGKLQRRVMKFTPKKSYLPPATTHYRGSTAGVTTKNTPTCTTNTGKVTGSAYETACKNFENLMELQAGWYPVDLDRISTNGTTKTYVGYLAFDPGSEVRITTVQELNFNSKYEVYLSTLYLNQFGNDKVGTMYDYILSTSGVREVKQAPTAAEDSGNVEPVQCVNCGGVFKPEEVFHLDDGDHLCDPCYRTDDQGARQYAFSVGITKRPQLGVIS